MDIPKGKVQGKAKHEAKRAAKPKAIDIAAPAMQPKSTIIVLAYTAKVIAVARAGRRTSRVAVVAKKGVRDDSNVPSINRLKL